MADVDIPAPDVSGNTDSPKTYVYVIGAREDRVKVGVANDVPTRLRALQTAHYEILSIAHEFVFYDRGDAYAIETRAHALLKASAISGEWFSVSADEAKAAVEQAIAEVQDEHRREEEVVRNRVMAVEKNAHVYLGPEITPAESWMRDIKDLIRFVLKQKEPEKERLIDFGDCIIFVGCREDEEAGEWLFFINDVSRWHMQEEDGSPYDASRPSRGPLGNPPCALFATVYQPLRSVA